MTSRRPAGKAKLSRQSAVLYRSASEQALYERLVQRGSETPDKIQIRMARNKLELAQRSKYDYCIMNDSVDRAVKEIIDILKEKRQ